MYITIIFVRYYVRHWQYEAMGTADHIKNKLTISKYSSLDLTDQYDDESSPCSSFS